MGLRLTTDSAMAHTDTASAPLMLRLTTDSAMAHTDTARGLLMPRLTTDLAMAHTDTARGPLMPRLTTDSAMAHTDTARGPLMPMLTTAMLDTEDPTAMARGPLRLTMDMAATAHTDTASKLGICSRGEDTSGINQIYTLKPKVPRTDMIREFCNLLHETKINFYTSW